ncbi:MAG: hypothetical protein J1F09_03335 [Oscillospiraceae bacterium]|nr:hypothetical protein [Oscillospiraceae bacterium]
MFKKFSAAAALAIFAAFSTAAYASSVGSAVEGAVDGVVNAGEDIVDGVVNAGEDVADGITGSNSGINNGVDPLTDSSNTGDVTDLKDGVPETSGTQSTSESNAVGDSSNEAKNPNTGISLGFAATSAVLAAMGVTLTTVRRKHD